MASMVSWNFHRVREITGRNKRDIAEVVEEDSDYEAMVDYLKNVLDVEVSEDVLRESRVFSIEDPSGEQSEAIAIPASAEEDQDAGILVRIKNQVVRRVRGSISYADEDYVQVQEYISQEGEIQENHLEKPREEFIEDVKEMLGNPRLQCNVCMFAGLATIASGKAIAPFAMGMFLGPFLPAIACIALGAVLVAAAVEYSPVSRKDICEEIGLCTASEEDYI